MSNTKSHTSSIIASLTKSYNQSKLNGKLNSEDIYLLDSIYKLLDGCDEVLNNNQKKTLKTLYQSILTNSKYICKAPIYKQYHIDSIPSFIQAETDDCNTLPIQDLIYYWQEPLNVRSEDILELINAGGYVETKPSDLKSNFINGKDINYIDIGLICFALDRVNENDNYVIIDSLNLDVTEGFESFYNSDLKLRIFISYNNYSHGIMNLKIRKI